MSKKIRGLLCLTLALAVLGGALLLWAGIRNLSPAPDVPPGISGSALYPAPHTGSPAPSVLLISRPGDGGRLLARELNRRGVNVLLLRDASPAALADAWDYLASADFSRLSSLGLLAREADIPAAAEALEDLSGSGREAAAAVFSGSDLSLCRGCTGRNVLFLTGREPDASALAAFYGDDTPAGRISGYFADGDARKVIVLPGSTPRWGEKDAMLSVFDWLGSSLGHVVELSDTDIAVSADRTLIAGGIAFLAAALGGGSLCIVKKRRFSHLLKE